MCEGLVGLGHLVSVLATLHSGTETVGRIQDLVHQTLSHGLLAALLREANEPAKSQSGGTAGANVSALSSLVTSTVGQPLIKVASFSYGVRQAFRGGKSGDAHGTAGNTHAGGQYGSAQSSYSAGGEN